MTFTILCLCTKGICPANCNIHCESILHTKTVNQAFTLKHVHTSSNENHEVEVRDNGVVVNHRDLLEVKA